MKTLNRNRPYAEVWGGSVSHRYEQDGMKFDSEGLQIGLTPEEARTVADTGGEDQVGATELAAAKALAQKTVAEIEAELPDLSDEVLSALRDVEAQGKDRTTLLAKIDAEIAERASKTGGEDQVGAQLGD